MKILYYTFHITIFLNSMFKSKKLVGLCRVLINVGSVRAWRRPPTTSSRAALVQSATPLHISTRSRRAEYKANAHRQSSTGVLQRHHQPASAAHTYPAALAQNVFRDPPPTTRGNGQTGHLLKTLIWLPVSEREREREIQKDREDAVVLGGAAPATGVLVARRAAGRRLRHLPPARHPHRRGRKPQARR